MDPENDKEKGRALTEEQRLDLVYHIKTLGLEEVAKRSGASELALAKAAAGIPASRGTVATCREYLAECADACEHK